jgi:hypothetical protein
VPERHKRGVRAPKKTADGEQLYKRVLFKVIIGKKIFHIRFIAEPNRFYNSDGVEKAIELVIEDLDKKFPRLEFKQVDILPNQFNFIATGVRQPPKGPESETSIGDNAGSSEAGVLSPGTPDSDVRTNSD